MKDNPLIIPILDILKQSDKAISEYDLMKSLESIEGLFPALSDDGQLALFQKHFLIMNALYQLQETLWQEHCYLQVSPLAIHVSLVEKEATNQLPDQGNDTLRSYYLDWTQFHDADTETVEALLNQFWQRFLAEDRQAESYQVLELDVGADWASIRDAYRRLAARHHPDRGGDAGQFMAIREAYEILQRTHGN